MPPALRYTLAVLAGIVTAFGLVSVFEVLGRMLVPPPKDVSFATLELARTSMSKITPAGFATVFVSHMAGAFGGPVVAGLIARAKPLLWPLLIGGLVFVASTVNFILLHVPIVPGTIDLLMVGTAIFLAYKVLRARLAD